MADEVVTIPGGEPAPALPPDSPIPPAPPAVMGDPANMAAAWESKYNGMRGAAIQQQAKARETEAKLSADLALAQNEATAGKETMVTMQTQLDTIPALQVVAEEKLKGDVANRRLRTILEYPQIVGAATETEVTADDGTKSIVRANPYLDMLMSSTLEGDAWTANVALIATTLNTPGTPPMILTGPSSGVPGAETPPDGKSELLQQAIAAGAEGDYSLQERLTNQIAELADKSNKK